MIPLREIPEIEDEIKQLRHFQGTIDDNIRETEKQIANARKGADTSRELLNQLARLKKEWQELEDQIQNLMQFVNKLASKENERNQRRIKEILGIIFGLDLQTSQKDAWLGVKIPKGLICPIDRLLGRELCQNICSAIYKYFDLRRSDSFGNQDEINRWKEEAKRENEKRSRHLLRVMTLMDDLLEVHLKLEGTSEKTRAWKLQVEHRFIKAISEEFELRITDRMRRHGLEIQKIRVELGKVPELLESLLETESSDKAIELHEKLKSATETAANLKTRLIQDSYLRYLQESKMKSSNIQLDRSRVIKILFLASNPSDTTRLRLDREIREIDRVLRQTEYRNKFDIEQHWAVRVTDLQGYLLRHKPDIVHFSGHGSNFSEIILEDESGCSCPISVHALSQLFSMLRDSTRCVVLNACYSEQQAEAIVKHINCVVGMSGSIGDSAAISFITAFYQALGYGRDIKTAFDSGCTQIDLENLGEQDIPKLLTKRQ